MKKLGIGIIGCGNISTAYLKLAPLFKGLEVRAVADINMEAATARAAEFNVKAQSVDDLLANPALDIVINLTIPDAHYPITKRILEAGKHAYSEKPLVLTLEQGTTLRDLAKAKGLSVGCRKLAPLARVLLPTWRWPSYGHGPVLHRHADKPSGASEARGGFDILCRTRTHNRFRPASGAKDQGQHALEHSSAAGIPLWRHDQLLGLVGCVAP